MEKLRGLINTSLNEDNAGRLTHFTKFLKESKDEEGRFTYQDIELKDFEIHQEAAGAAYDEIITDLTASMGGRFDDLMSTPIFKPLVSILDVSSWPKSELLRYCDTDITNL